MFMNCFKIVVGLYALIILNVYAQLYRMRYGVVCCAELNFAVYFKQNAANIQ